MTGTRKTGLAVEAGREEEQACQQYDTGGYSLRGRKWGCLAAKESSKLLS
jgi:hypothetical protein